jgi:hypothetical protein
MTGRRITAGLSLLCALVFCAFSASSASAAGTTAFECVKNGGAMDFSDADCASFVGAGEGEFGHVALTPKTSIKVISTSASAKLMGTVAGITTTLSATGFTSKNAKIENTEAGGAMVVKGTGEGEITGVTVTEGPAGCKVVGSTLKVLSTEGISKEMEVEFKPTSGAFKEFTFTGCTNSGLNVTYKCIGSANAIINGANLNFTEASTSSLKFAGHSAFLIATATGKIEGGNPLSPTTTTP